MGEQVPHIDRRRTAVGQARFEVRQEPCDRIIQIEPATFYQRERSGRYQGLGERGPSEYGIECHGNVGLAICVAGGAGIHGLTVDLHKNHSADHPARLNRLVNDRVDRLLHKWHPGRGTVPHP